MRQALQRRPYPCAAQQEQALLREEQVSSTKLYTHLDSPLPAREWKAVWGFEAPFPWNQGHAGDAVAKPQLGVFQGWLIPREHGAQEAADPPGERW